MKGRTFWSRLSIKTITALLQSVAFIFLNPVWERKEKLKLGSTLGKEFKRITHKYGHICESCTVLFVNDSFTTIYRVHFDRCFEKCDPFRVTPPVPVPDVI